MNNFFKNLIDQAKNLLQRGTFLQKGIVAGLVIALIIGIIFIFSFSSSPDYKPLFKATLTQEQVDKISLVLDREGVDYTVNNNIISIANVKDAQRMKSLLFQEGLVPTTLDPWQIFDVERWTIDDFQQNINFRRAITQELELHLKALNDVDNAHVIIDIPESNIFGDKKNVTASVQLVLKPGSDLRENKVKLKGIENLVIAAIADLSQENLIITDESGMQLNDFTGDIAEGRIKEVDRQRSLIKKEELNIQRNVERALSRVFSGDRSQIINVTMNASFDKVQSKAKEYKPIITVPDDPNTPYSELKYVENFIVSQSTGEKDYKGTGVIPEGPPGVEGQVPAEYNEAKGIIGTYTDRTNTQNNALNETISDIEKQPMVIDSISIGIAIDGEWSVVYGDDGKPIIKNNKIERLYKAPSPEIIANLEQIIRNSLTINLDRPDRGVSISLNHIPFDRSKEHEALDKAYIRDQYIQMTMLIGIISLVVVILLVIIIRLISKELERRRRLREEELARQQALMREQIIQQTDEEDEYVDRGKQELEQSVIEIAQQHPQNAALLIRTWLNQE